MKKILAYASVAVLLGVVTMLAPFALFVSEMGSIEMDAQAERSYPLEPQFMQKAPSKTEQAYGIPPATYPQDVLFIAFMLTLSLVLALGVMRHSVKKTAF